jgi:hypothetical protein
MFGQEQSPQQPLFFVLALISAILTIGYFWGNRQNRKLFLALFDELIDVIKPQDQEYGNIGGTREYYSNFSLKKESPLARIDAKFTFLPRHLWPYLPIAMLIEKYDKLLIALHFKEKLRLEGHLIEANYARSRMANIPYTDQLNELKLKWGKHDYYIYSKSKKMYVRFKELINNINDPGVIRHITFIPAQKKCFIFLVPQKGQVSKDLAPIYQRILSLIEK